MKIRNIITEASTDHGVEQAIKTFRKAADDLTKALNHAVIEDVAMSKKTNPNVINPIMVGDVAHSVSIINDRLNTLDQRYGWKKHMQNRRRGMK